MVLFRTMKSKIKKKSFQDKGQRINKNNKTYFFFLILMRAIEKNVIIIKTVY